MAVCLITALLLTVDIQPTARSAIKTKADKKQWMTRGFHQANTMGGGQAAIPTSGRSRAFVLMGQSNLQRAAQAAELKAPYRKKHERIRIWADGTWEYFVPRNRFGPGVFSQWQCVQTNWITFWT